MKRIVINKLDIVYEEFGRGKNTIILLHGWGQSHAFWKGLIHWLEKDYHIYSLDLPGFGLSQEPDQIWDIPEYTVFLHEFVLVQKIEHPIIIGHSFGGRIACLYTTRFPVNKLILYSSGGPGHATFSKRVFQIIVSVGRYMAPNYMYALHTTLFKHPDYVNKILINRQRSLLMLKIYISRRFDIASCLKDIKVKTLILVGKKDFISHPSVGDLLHERIKHSRLVKIPSTTHFAHLESPTAFKRELLSFLNES